MYRKLFIAISLLYTGTLLAQAPPPPPGGAPGGMPIPGIVYLLLVAVGYGVYATKFKAKK